MQIATATVVSPLGELYACATEQGLCGLTFDAPALLRAALARRFAKHGALTFVAARDPHGVCAAFAAYLGGTLAALDALAVDAGGTDFQRDVWAALRTVPVGRTSTYAQIAATVGRPSAVRAVGAANGANPIAVVVPCHRVIASDGKLQGYGGGLERKRWLLVHERALLA